MSKLTQSNSVRQPSPIYLELREKRDPDDGAAVIASKQVAVLVRQKLKMEFPNVKFSVRSSYNAIRIGWTDGPTTVEVDPVVNCYSFGGFDGSIDMEYSGSNWLLPDGSMQPAGSHGTEGSRGSVAGFSTDCPQPGAILVKYGPKYVFTSREVSPQLMTRLVDDAARHYGFDVDPKLTPWGQYIPELREYVATLAHRLECERAMEAMQNSAGWRRVAV